MTDPAPPGQAIARRLAVAGITVLAVVALLAGVRIVRSRVSTVRSTASAARGPGVAAASAGLVTLEVGGMQCDACVEKVHRELAKVPGVSGVEVDLAHQRAVVTCSVPVADSLLTTAVRRAGPEYIGFVLSR